MKKFFIFLMIIVTLLLTGCEKDNDRNLGWDIPRLEFSIDDTLDHVNNKDCKVILIYGQSNATGYSVSGYIEDNDKELYDEYTEGFSNVKINYITEGNTLLTGNEFMDVKLDNINISYTFGPEMGIAEEYSKKYPNEDIYIIKYSWGGSSLANEWLTEKGNRNIMYQNAIDFTKANLDYLKSIGYNIHIEGICWMQGESDASEQLAGSYYNNTVKFVSYFRSDLKAYQENIKFVDAFIEDIDIWVKYEEINDAKLRFANESNLNYVVDTIALGLTTTLEPYEGADLAHYDSMSMVSLGRGFASKLME